MSSTTRVVNPRQAPPAPTPQPPVAPADLTPARPVRRGVLARAFEGTPGKLRLAATFAVLASLAFAVLGALAFADRRSALEDARAQAAQLVRVQGIGIELARADAFATNAFLAQGTGVPPADVVKQYEEAISTASRRIADAARAQPADGPALARVNDQLTDYTARIASAWVVKQDPETPTLANGYLGLASQTLLREGMLPALDDVTKASAGRVDDAFAASDAAGRRLILTGVLVVLVLLGVAVWLALRTKRAINVPLTAAIAAITVFTMIGSLVMTSVQARSREVRNTSYAATRAMAEARVAAYRAKADESITLIRQNFTLANGAYQDPAQQAIATVRTRLGAVTAARVTLPNADPLKPWADVHTTVIRRVNSGDVEQARQIAIGPSTSVTSSNGAFLRFESDTAPVLTAQAARVSDELTRSSWLLLVLALLALAVGVLASVASWVGISQRLEEYR